MTERFIGENMDKEILEVLKNIDKRLAHIQAEVALQGETSQGFFGLWEKGYYEKRYDNGAKLEKLMNDQNGILGSIRYKLGIWSNEMNKPDEDQPCWVGI